MIKFKHFSRFFMPIAGAIFIIKSFYSIIIALQTKTDIFSSQFWDLFHEHSRQFGIGEVFILSMLLAVILMFIRSYHDRLLKNKYR